MFIIRYLFTATLLVSIVSFASPASDSCEAVLTSPDLKRHEYVIVPSGSGRDSDVVPLYKDFVEQMSKAGGVLDQLGITRTQQVVEFLKGVDMLAVTATPAAQPIAHFLDGSQILNGFGKPYLIYEVVYPGKDFHHGYYRDDMSVDQQLSILMHVVGHNHFAANSQFVQYRTANPTESARYLNQAMLDAYKVAPKLEVENFYLHLQTLSGLVDYHTGHYEAPAHFDISHLTRPQNTGGNAAELDKVQAILSRGLPRATENVMPAFVQRLLNSPYTPDWQKNIAIHWPNLAPYRSALVHTQIMNEGWASLMQEMIMDHMGADYNTINHWFTAQHVVSWQPYLKMDDPYWLGVRLWKRIREKFDQRPEVVHLKTKIEKDRAFIEFATTEVIAKMDDYQFLNLGLDANMVQRMGLALLRKAKPVEAVNLNLPPYPQDGREHEPWIVVSRDPDRIRQSIIENVLYRKTKFNPRVVLRSFNRNGTGQVELAIDDEFGNQLPINKKTIGPALYALASVLQQPISFEGSFLLEKGRPRDLYNYLPLTGTVEKLARARVVVDLNGLVSVTVLENREGEKFEEKLKQELSMSINAQIQRLFLEDDATLDRIAQENPHFLKTAMQAIGQSINERSVDSLIEHAPAAADAINEYYSKVGARVIKAFELAMNGRGGIVNTSRGLFLQALPPVVSIEFDQNYVQSLLDQSIPGPMDTVRIAFSNPFDGTDGSADVKGPTNLPVGGGGWVPKPGQGGGGKGKPAPGDEGDDPSSGPSPGDVGLDPSWIPIPEGLYAQFLNERVKLPRLRPLSGETKATRARLKGRTNRRNGQLVVDRTTESAIKLGFGSLIGQDLDPYNDILETIDEGFSLMRPKDYVVRKVQPQPRPDTNAVIFFARDASGSTSEYTQLYKQFVFDMKTLIKSNYPNVTIVYLIFDTKAHVMSSEQKFFETELGGGTSYRAAFAKIRELMEQNYPAGKFDRFPFIVGDLGDLYDEPTQNELAAMLQESSYAGVLKAGYGMDEFTSGMVDLDADSEFFGFVDLGDVPEDYGIKHIRRILKNEESD